VAFPPGGAAGFTLVSAARAGAASTTSAIASPAKSVPIPPTIRGGEAVRCIVGSRSSGRPGASLRLPRSPGRLLLRYMAFIAGPAGERRVDLRLEELRIVRGV